MWWHKFYRDYLKNVQTQAGNIYVRHILNEISQLILERKGNYYE